MKTEEKRLPRRTFLLSASLAAPAAAIPSEAESAERTPADDADPRRVVLKDTPHIRTYYDLARR